MSTPYAHLHTHPAGPNDARPTALQIIRDESLLGAWPDRTVLITGATAGIGIETVRALYATGCTIYLCARSLTKAEAVKTDVEGSGSSEGTGKIHVLELSLDDLSSVRAAAAAFLARSARLDILINNAGLTSPTFQKTIDGHELLFSVHHLGPFLLTTLLTPALQAAATPDRASRVINVSSAAHNMYTEAQIDLSDLDWSRREYNPLNAYGSSKTATILHANALDRRFGTDPAHPVRAYSLHPGAIMTALTASAAPEDLAEWAKYKDIFKSVEQGAATTVWCAVAKGLERVGGVYCEDCGVAEEAGVGEDGQRRRDKGYAPWAMGDEKTEEALWELSERLVGL